MARISLKEEAICNGTTAEKPVTKRQFCEHCGRSRLAKFLGAVSGGWRCLVAAGCVSASDRGIGVDGARDRLRSAWNRYAFSGDGVQRRAARRAVLGAVRRCELIRPSTCSRCHQAPAPDARGRRTVQFHHSKGYEASMWLIGEWLCRVCHEQSDHGA